METKDVFRQEYREILPEVKDTIWVIKKVAENLLNELEAAEVNLLHDKRCMALAKTNLEQAIMWAVKGLT